MPGDPASSATGLRRVVYLALAGIFFALGMIGVVLPGLPTTPFLLLTSYLLLRSWPALNNRMLRSRFVGSILRDWQQHGGVRPHVKVKSIALIAAMLTASVWFGRLPLPASAAILMLGMVGIVIVARLPNVQQPDTGNETPRQLERRAHSKEAAIPRAQTGRNSERQRMDSGQNGPRCHASTSRDLTD